MKRHSNFAQTLTSFIIFLGCAVSAWGQGDRGAITGTVSDPAGAVVANAAIQARHVETGTTYDGATTSTGNYTLSQLPVGTYEVSVAVPGFKKFTRQGLTLEVAQTLRVDIPLEVGASTESVTITAEATLLKTESGEMSHNVSVETLDNLPILGIGAAAAGSSGIRNPTEVAALLPGTFVLANSNVRINGAPGNTASYRVEGQDASNGQVPATQAQTQPSVDAIQEVTIQTSNFAAEYGQVGGGFFNYTMRSGTNRLHGSVYDYFVNEALNAATPWVNARNVARRNDYGFTIGGPIDIPKVYNGHDKTFFFFNFEQFRETQNVNTQTITVPATAYRNGNFTPALTGKNLCLTASTTINPTKTPNCDPLGRPIFENTIYDPRTARLAPNGQIVTDPFPDNTILPDRVDPVALKVQSLIPLPTNPQLANNAIFPYPSQRVTSIPALKVDHSLGANMKLSYYWSETKTSSQYSPTFGGSDGLPVPVTAAIGTFITATVQRLNFEDTLSPTLLFHAGVGYQDNDFTDDPPVLDYNPAQQLGLVGATVNRLFPNFTFVTNAQGGSKNLGPGSNRHPLLYEKPTANVSLTLVKGNHTYKAGGEMRVDSNSSTLYTYTNGIYNFSANETALPSYSTASIGGGTVGFPYASFLLGLVDSVRIAQVENIRLGKHQLGFFVQDTWKVTRRFTLDYGLRYDFGTYLKEHNGELAQFSPTTPNPSAGGQPGAVIFEGDGPGRCNCTFGKNYPWAFGPRLGGAYQLTPKTVLRAGWGVVYSGTADANGATQGGLTAPAPVNAPSFGSPVMILRQGIPFAAPPFPNFNPGQYPQAGYATTQAPLVWYDQNAGRPARQVQWSIGVQREIFKDLVVEASYVGNRGVWWNTPSLIDVNAITPDILAAHGLNLNNNADQQVLTQPLGSTLAVQRGFKAPYAGFPLTATVAQSLRPFPQFNSITSLFSPLGDTWYDSLQVKGTKRYSHGLSFTTLFTWSKQLSTAAPSNVVIPGTGGAPVNDVFNRGLNKYLSAFDQPLVFTIAASYTSPALHINKVLSWVARDWSLNTLLSYASGLPIQAPIANNNLNQLLLRNNTGTFANRVPGVPLFTQDLNCHCFDPTRTFVLNPAAWVDPPAGQFGSSAAYYTDYRFQRRPNESLGLGRIFRIRERASLNIRAEFSNIFNRAEAPNPTATNAGLSQTRNATTGAVTAGFGFINTGSTGASTSVGTPTSRQGTIVARFTF